MISSVAIIGGGFSGALQAINLLRHDGPRALLIERRQHISRGVAYSAAHPDHLLNVRAENMSAFPDERNGYRNWLVARGEKRTLTPCLLYGDYLNSLLADIAAQSGDRLQLIHGSAINLQMSGNGIAVGLDDGRMVRAGAAVLAMGNLPPHNPPRLFPDMLKP